MSDFPGDIIDADLGGDPYGNVLPFGASAAPDGGGEAELEPEAAEVAAPAAPRPSPSFAAFGTDVWRDPGIVGPKGLERIREQQASPLGFVQRNPLLVAGGAAAAAWYFAPRDQRALWCVVSAVAGYIAATQVLPRLIR